MITVIPNDHCFEFIGLSTDIKPIGNNAKNGNVNYPISNGSRFFEMDTSRLFMLSLSKNADSLEIIAEWIEVFFK